MDIALLILGIISLLFIIGGVAAVAGMLLNFRDEVKKAIVLTKSEEPAKMDLITSRAIAQVSNRLGKMEESLQEWQRSYVARFEAMVKAEIDMEAKSKPMVSYIYQLQYAKDHYCETPAERATITRIIKRINENGRTTK